MSELVFLFSADADIQTAYEFYEAYQVGRGEVFMRHLDVGFGRLRTFPEIAPIFHEAHRRLLVHGFPYGIFYTVAGVASSSLASWTSAKTPTLFAEDLADETPNHALQRTAPRVAELGVVRRFLASRETPP